MPWTWMTTASSMQGPRAPGKVEEELWLPTVLAGPPEARPALRPQGTNSKLLPQVTIPRGHLPLLQLVCQHLWEEEVVILPTGAGGGAAGLPWWPALRCDFP